MISRGSLNLILIGVAVFLGAGLAFSESGSRSTGYSIQVESPSSDKEGGREVQAKGKVFIDEEDNVRSDMVLLSFIRPGTSPRYYVQGSMRLAFDKRKTRTGDIGYEADWELPLRVGGPDDFGKRYYVYFVLIGERALSEIEVMEKMAKGQGIERVVFEKTFLNDSSQYYTITDRIPIYRKFPERKK